MLDGEKLEDYLLPKDIRTAVDYYYAMVEARDILTTTMGRALVRAGQCGGSVWRHLYAMHGEGKLWDGADHSKPTIPHTTELDRNLEISKEVHRWHEVTGRFYEPAFL